VQIAGEYLKPHERALRELRELREPRHVAGAARFGGGRERGRLAVQHGDRVQRAVMEARRQLGEAAGFCGGRRVYASGRQVVIPSGTLPGTTTRAERTERGGRSGPDGRKLLLHLRHSRRPWRS
jgi:hypothetical protein